MSHRRHVAGEDYPMFAPSVVFVALSAAALNQTPVDPAPVVPTTLDAWVSQVNMQIDRRLIAPVSGDGGVAIVSFRRGEDGRPCDLKVLRGSPLIARAALLSVKALGVLPPMPSYVPTGQRVTFQFLVGADDTYERKRLAMFRAADQTNMAFAARLKSTSQLAAYTRR